MLSYKQKMEIEVKVIQVLALIVEGSTDSRQDLMQKVRDKFDSLSLPDLVKQSIKEPDEIFGSCFTCSQNLPAKLMKELESMADIDLSNFQKQTWKVNIVEMLEPRFKASDVKKARQKRRSYYTKVELLVSLISELSRERIEPTLTEKDLDLKVEKLNKIESEEYLAMLRSVTSLKR